MTGVILSAVNETGASAELVSGAMQLWAVGILAGIGIGTSVSVIGTVIKYLYDLAKGRGER